MNPINLNMFQRILFIIIMLFNLFRVSWSSLKLSPDMNEMERYVNESYIVTCYDDHEKPVRWTNDRDVTVGETGHPSVSRMSSNSYLALVFERITTSEQGQYFCKSADETISFKMNVNSPIHFVDAPTRQTIEINTQGFIKCKAEGKPKPAMLWNYKGNELTEQRFKTEPDGLLIKKVRLEDQGLFTCYAYQITPTSSTYEKKRIQVIVQHGPIRKKPVHAKVIIANGYVGGEVNLTCEAIAEPAATFTWLRHGRKVVAGRIIQKPHWSVLQLFVHNQTDFGEYMCKAKNQFGTLEQIFNLQEGVKPPKPEALKLRSFGSDHLDLVVVGPDLNLNRTELKENMLPIGYRFQYRIKGAGIGWSQASVVDFHEIHNNASYIISGLVHNAEYEVRVATRNPAGLSDYTSIYKYKTLHVHADTITSGLYSHYCFNIYYVSLLYSTIIALFLL